MSVLTWQNAAGSLGSYPSGSSISLQFSAVSNNNASMVSYKILSGSLPIGTKASPIQLSLDGLLSGTFENVTEQSNYSFTIRAYDQYGAIRDRTFNITVIVSSAPVLTTPPGLLLSVDDSIWIDIPLEYTNPVSTNPISIRHSSGNLPHGVYVTSDGRIQGYPAPPVTGSGSPITKRYSFTIELTSPLGNSSSIYIIEVFNQLLTKPPHSRKPVIYNSRPLVKPISIDDPYYRFYGEASTVIGTVLANDFFTFKVLGQDFDGDALRYSFGYLPEGLVGDPVTGWITGIPTMDSTGVNDCEILVSVSKLSRPLVTSATEVFKIRIINNLVEDISWTTTEDLGTIYNNTVSELFLKATSIYDLVYSVTSGDLPANLTLLESGIIAGRVAFQPTGELLSVDTVTEFVFTVVAYASNQTQIRSTKTFRLKVRQYYEEPIENIYFKVTPSIGGRTVLASLLNDTSLIPNSYLYRPNDFYFGKATSVKIIHSYGMYASSLSQYIAAIQKNHYYRNIVLGGLKTARALDDNHNVIYEVVYSELIDDLVNSDGVSIPMEITWPTPISLNLGPWTINNTDIYTSDGVDYTSLSPGSVEVLYPASIDNMRTEVISQIGQNSDNLLLPRWMTTQQENGETIGFVECWVLCYTLPGKSQEIKDNIETNWEYSLNEIDCTFDRYLIDKTSTSNWNTNLLSPTWTQLPSEIPNYDDPDRHDLPVLFPRKTILPKDNNY